MSEGRALPAGTCGARCDSPHNRSPWTRDRDDDFGTVTVPERGATPSATCWSPRVSRRSSRSAGLRPLRARDRRSVAHGRRKATAPRHHRPTAGHGMVGRRMAAAAFCQARHDREAPPRAFLDGAASARRGGAHRRRGVRRREPPLPRGIRLLPPQGRPARRHHRARRPLVALGPHRGALLRAEPGMAGGTRCSFDAGTLDPATGRPRLRVLRLPTLRLNRRSRTSAVLTGRVGAIGRSNPNWVILDHGAPDHGPQGHRSPRLRRVVVPLPKRRRGTRPLPRLAWPAAGAGAGRRGDPGHRLRLWCAARPRPGRQRL